MKMDNGGQPIYGTDFTHRIGNTSGTSPILTNMGNGVYRVSETKTSSTSNLVRSGVIKETSNSVNGFRITALQLEALPYATSYIPTSGAIATRLADVITGAGDVTTFNDSEGVLYAEMAALDEDFTNRYITISDGTINNRVVLRFNLSNSVSGFVRSGGITQAVFIHSINILDTNKVAIKYKENDFALWVNGVKLSTDTSGNSPIGLSELHFADGSGTGNEFKGKVKSVITFDTALTDAELECLTTI